MADELWGDACDVCALLPAPADVRRARQVLGVSMDVLWYGEEEAEWLAWRREQG